MALETLDFTKLHALVIFSNVCRLQPLEKHMLQLNINTRYASKLWSARYQAFCGSAEMLKVVVGHQRP